MFVDQRKFCILQVSSKREYSQQNIKLNRRIMKMVHSHCDNSHYEVKANFNFSHDIEELRTFATSEPDLDGSFSLVIGRPLYLDWVCNFLTVSRFAEYYLISEALAERIIDLGRSFEERDIFNYETEITVKRVIY